ncbi:MAG: ribosomal protein S18-alanine N-acetyltransferase [Acidobacteriaceae bacterium]|nr:ribosomal protein S18-alanine N-acetyltransferase [Acidobacteriaceae bacterium]
MSLLLRPATPHDLPALLRIEAESFADPNWRAEDFSRYDTMVAEADGQIAGFLVSRQTFSGNGEGLAEREILNVAVAPSFRRNGIATLLLKHELQFDAVHFLEVRESNAAAQALYRKLGFVAIARRPKYYERPEETAIVMQLK